jgi:hypothetical protein
MTISQKVLVPYLEQRHIMGHMNSLLAQFPISESLPLEWRRWQKWYCHVRVMDMSIIITLGGVRVSAFWEHTWLAVILNHVVIVVAPAA